MKRNTTWCLLLFLSAALFCVSGCSHDDAYAEEIALWQQQRISGLKKARGWLSLAGLYPIGEGTQYICFTDACDITFPGERDDTLGYVRADSSGLFFMPAQTVYSADEGVFEGQQIRPEEAPLLHQGALYWTFLERGDHYFLRLWDTLSAAREAFDRIPNFPVTTSWRIPVSYTPAPSGTTVTLDDVLGLKRRIAVEGTLSGEVDGQIFDLLALEEDSTSWFVLFEDVTTGDETYAAGRYLNVNKTPDASGTLHIDFNKAYNPPCAVTPYATCLLAPPENRLPFAVTAGEKAIPHLVH